MFQISIEMKDMKDFSEELYSVYLLFCFDDVKRGSLFDMSQFSIRPWKMFFIIEHSKNKSMHHFAKHCIGQKTSYITLYHTHLIYV